MERSVKMIHKHVVDDVKGFIRDYKRLFKASPVSAVLLVLIEVGLGLVVILELGIVAKMVDAIIGGRAIRVVTSDITKSLVHQIILFVSLVPALILHHQWTGLAEKLGKTIRRATFVLSTFFAAFPLSPILLFFAALGGFILQFEKTRWPHWVFSLLVVGAGAFEFYRLVNFAVYSGVTVGSVVYIGGALFAFTGFIALAPYMSIKDV